MSETKSTFVRPLSPGEILDRALALIASKPFSIVALMTIAFVPDAILHFYRSAMWVADNGVNPLATGGYSLFVIASMVRFDHDSVPVGTNADVESLIADFLFFVMTGACAVIGAYIYARRSVTIADALKRLSDRWVSVALTAVVCVIALYVIQMAYDELSRGLNSLPPYTEGLGAMELFSAERIAIAFIYGIVQEAAWLVACGIITSVILEAESIPNVLTLGLSSISGVGRIGVALLLGAAFTIIDGIVFELGLGWSIVLYFTHAPIVDTICYLIIAVVPQSFFSAAAIVYYFDSRLRQGVNVAEDFVARLDTEAIAET